MVVLLSFNNFSHVSGVLIKNSPKHHWPIKVFHGQESELNALNFKFHNGKVAETL